MTGDAREKEEVGEEGEIGGNEESRSSFEKKVADLNHYGRAVNQCTTVEEVVPLTLEAMNNLFGFTYTSFLEPNEPEVSSSLKVKQSTQPGMSIGDDYIEGPSVEAFEERETVIKDEKNETVVAVPAVMGDEVLGVLETKSRDEAEFDDEKIRLLEILASHAATAISNIRSRKKLERTKQDLSKRNEALEMYDSILRHDLRNKLTVVEGYAEEVLMDVEDPVVENMVKRIHGSAQSSIQMIQTMGDIVKTINEKDDPDKIDLREIIEETVKEVLDDHETLSIEFEPEKFEHKVYADELLSSVFINLLSNAAFHNEGDVNVRLETRDIGTHIEIRVADDGKGIPEDIRDKIFEMSFKGPDSDGTGLGLGFVKTLVESYGGDVDVEESEEGGAEFKVALRKA